jgi:farnesyl-diphosphate farnesyltransferase
MVIQFHSTFYRLADVTTAPNGLQADSPRLLLAKRAERFILQQQMTDILNDLLRATSRSFYLTLRVLPAAVRPQIGLAYLLARTTDTIADTEIVPPAQRLAALHALRDRILGHGTAPLNFRDLARAQAAPAERALLENVEVALAELQKHSTADQRLVREVLETITSGQELDLKRFESGRAGSPLPAASCAHGIRRAEDSAPYQPIIALHTDAELDDYTYRVAGCVGGFWTKLCRAHLFPNAKLDAEQLLTDGIRFGKGLQLVNILRDLAADLRKGRCYLPGDGLAKLGLAPADLLNPATEPKLRPLYHEWLDRAESHLAAGWAYTNSLPWRCARVRLACAWPILIGLETIKRLRAENVLDAGRRIKVGRAEVRKLMLCSTLCYPLPWCWRRLVSSRGRQVH